MTEKDVAAPLPVDAYRQVVRVVSHVFIAGALLGVTIGGIHAEPAVYVLLAAGAVLVVLGQDLLPPEMLGRWRLGAEAAVALILVSLLVLLTGGAASPFFVGYLLVVGCAALLAHGRGALVLALIAAAAYLTVVVAAAGALGGPLDAEALGRVAFNLIAIGLITYLATVVAGEHRRAREAAVRLSRFDQLTGIYSRSYVLTRLEQEIQRASRAERPFSLLMLDLDGLKAANDQHGHDVGDQLLRQVADGLSRAVRTIDVVGRYGGDEMLVVLPETDQAGALRVAEKLRRAVRGSAVPVEEGTARTSASIGLASYPDDGRSAAELINRADMAMYEAKRRGRDQIVRYSRPADVARRAGEGMPAEGMPAEGMPAAPEIGAQGAPGDPL